MTGLSINQDIDSSLAAVADADRREVRSNLTQKLAKRRKGSDLDLRIYNVEAFENIIPFKTYH